MRQDTLKDDAVVLVGGFIVLLIDLNALESLLLIHRTGITYRLSRTNTRFT